MEIMHVSLSCSPLQCSNTTALHENAICRVLRLISMLRAQGRLQGHPPVLLIPVYRQPQHPQCPWRWKALHLTLRLLRRWKNFKNKTNPTKVLFLTSRVEYESSVWCCSVVQSWLKQRQGSSSTDGELLVSPIANFLALLEKSYYTKQGFQGYYSYYTNSQLFTMMVGCTTKEFATLVLFKLFIRNDIFRSLYIYSIH